MLSLSLASDSLTVALCSPRQPGEKQKQAEIMVRRRCSGGVENYGGRTWFDCGMDGDNSLWLVSKGCSTPRIPKSQGFPLEVLLTIQGGLFLVDQRRPA